MFLPSSSLLRRAACSCPAALCLRGRRVPAQHASQRKRGHAALGAALGAAQGPRERGEGSCTRAPLCLSHCPGTDTRLWPRGGPGEAPVSSPGEAGSDQPSRGGVISSSSCDRRTGTSGDRSAARLKVPFPRVYRPAAPARTIKQSDCDISQCLGTDCTVASLHGSIDGCKFVPKSTRTGREAFSQ